MINFDFGTLYLARLYIHVTKKLEVWLYIVTCRKKTKSEKEAESCISEEFEETVVAEKLPGLLGPDPALWSHISHVKTNIQTLPQAHDQVQQLARQVLTHGFALTRVIPSNSLSFPLSQVCQRQDGRSRTQDGHFWFWAVSEWDTATSALQPAAPGRGEGRGIPAPGTSL